MGSDKGKAAVSVARIGETNKAKSDGIIGKLSWNYGKAEGRR